MLYDFHAITLLQLRGAKSPRIDVAVKILNQNYPQYQSKLNPERVGAHIKREDIHTREEISQETRKGDYYVFSMKYSPMGVQEELLEEREVRDHLEFPL